MIDPAPALVVLQVVILRDGLLVGSEIFFPGRYLIGSGGTADLRLDDAWVEPAHAVLHFEPDRTTVENTSAQAGTYVNGHKVGTCEIRPIDEVACGPYLLKIRPLTQKAQTESRPPATTSTEIDPGVPLLRLATPAPTPSGTVLSTRRKTANALAAVPFQLVDAPRKDEPTQNVTMEPVFTDRTRDHLFLELYWDGALREVRSFAPDEKRVLAATHEDCAFPLFGFTLPEEPFVLAEFRKSQQGFRLFVPPSAQAERQPTPEAAFEPLLPEALETEGGGAHVISLARDSSIRITEGSMSLIARVAPSARARRTPFRKLLPLLAFCSVGLSFGGFFAFLQRVSHRPGVLLPRESGAEVPTAAIHQIAVRPKPTVDSEASAPIFLQDAPPEEIKFTGTVNRISPRRVGVLGEIDRRGVARTVNAHLQAVQDCYAKARVLAPALKGRVTMEWTVSPSGHVLSARPRRSTLQSRDVENCLAHEIKSWQFPAARGGAAVVSYPF